jgi:hypothetical protein
MFEPVLCTYILYYDMLYYILLLLLFFATVLTWWRMLCGHVGTRVLRTKAAAEFIVKAYQKSYGLPVSV